MTEGLKFDRDKPAFHLLPPFAMALAADVLTFGSKKYAPRDWQKVDRLQDRYLAAALRHINAFQRGEYVDPESQLHHLAHALVSMAFVLDDFARHGPAPV